MPTIDISDFSGGLTTALDETRLSPTRSAYARNFNITDSGSLERRAGSRYETTAAGAGATGAPITSLARYIQKDGDAYWLAVHGGAVSAVYQHQDLAGSSSGWTTAEAEEIASSGPRTILDYPMDSVSQGRFVQQTGTVTYAIPTATDVTLKAYCSSAFPASARPQGGAWESVASILHALSWTAGSGQVEVAPHSPAASSLCLKSTVNGTEIRRTYNLGPQDDNSPRAIEFWVAHRGGYNGSRTRVEVPIGATGASGSPANAFWVVADQLSTTWKLGYGHNGYSSEAYRDTGVNKGTPISFLFSVKPPYLRVYYRTSLTASWTLLLDQYLKPYQPNFYPFNMTWLGFVSKCTKAGETSLSHLDALFRDGVEIYDGGTLAPWVGSTPSGASAYLASDWAITTPRVYVDTFTYGYFTGWQNAASGIAAPDGLVGEALLDDKMWFAFPARGMAYASGAPTLTAASGSASGVSGGLLLQHQRRFFVARKASDKAFLAYSATLGEIGGEPDFGAGGTIWLKGKDSGGDIMAMGVWDNNLWVLTPGELHVVVISGPDPATDWYTKLITPAVGCKAPKSFVTLRDGFAWLASDGAVRAFGRFAGLAGADGTGTIELSAAIAPDVREVLKEETVGAHYEGRLYFACGSNVYIYQLPDPDTRARGAWLPVYTYPFEITSLLVTSILDPLGYGLFAGTADGHIVRLETGETDAGGFDEAGNPISEPIVPVWRVPWLAPGGYDTKKHFRRCWLRAYAPDPQVLSISPEADDRDGINRQLPVGPDTEVTPVRFPLSARGRAVRYTLQGAGAAARLRISGLTVEYDDPRRA